tara:strand:- start:4251 stop:5618 length:1368 start_codon:yes stop_codon:yes gene_type:complete
VSKVLIKAQTDLTQYGMLPGYNSNKGRLSDEEQRFNIDRAVDAMDDVPSLDEIYTDRAYDTALARPNIENLTHEARLDTLRNLVQGDTRQYKDYIKALKEIYDTDADGFNDPMTMALPESIRQYYSRQETLPEHAPSMHSENWQMPDGSIRPGAIAPINAVKQMGEADIESMMQGAGLLPVYNPKIKPFEVHQIPSQYRFNFSRKEDEDDIPLYNPLNLSSPATVNRNQLGSWATGANINDIRNITMDSESLDAGQGGLPFVGIRGLNVKDDKVQVRPKRGNPVENLNEAAIQSRIPPSRLVPIRHRMDDITGKQARDGYVYPSKREIIDAFGRRPRNVPSVDYIRSLPLTTYPEQFSDAYDKFGKIITSSGKSKDTYSDTPSIIEGSAMRRDVTPPSWGVQHEKMKDISPEMMREMARQLEQEQSDRGLSGLFEVPRNESMTFENAERLLPFYE